MSDTQRKQQTAEPVPWGLRLLEYSGAEYKGSLFTIFKEIKEEITNKRARDYKITMQIIL